MSSYDRLWARVNKKPHGRNWTYFTIILPWVLVGISGTFATLWLTGAIARETPTLIPAIISWVYTFGIGIWVTKIDKRRGYFDSLHSNYLRRREEKLARIESENKTEV